MLDILRSFNFNSIFKLDEVNTDNNVFKLHYKATVSLLLAFSVLLTSKQYFGEPIVCDQNTAMKQIEVLNVFCWIQGTFTVKSTLADKKVPGLGLEPFDDPGSVNRQMYYQWVSLVFCVQALMFYLPRYLWRTWESGRLHFLTSDLTGPIPNSDWKSDKLVQYLLHSKYPHNMYMIRYTFCEFLNLVNVVSQIYFMDWLISGNFSIYGIAYATNHLVNPMDSTFPKVTKCTFYKYGPTGTLMNYDTLCVLTLNVLNEKFFLVLWYWMFFLLFMSCCAFVYRAFFLFVLKFRVYLLRAQIRDDEKAEKGSLVEGLSYGQFFMLYRIGKNINPIVYRELVTAVEESIDKSQIFKKDPKLIHKV